MKRDCFLNIKVDRYRRLLCFHHKGLFLLWPLPLLIFNGFWTRSLLTPLMGAWPAYEMALAIPPVVLILASLLHQKKELTPILLALFGLIFFSFFSFQGGYAYLSAHFPKHISGVPLFLERLNYAYLGSLALSPLSLMCASIALKGFFQPKEPSSTTFGSAGFSDFKTLKKLTQKEGLPVGGFKPLRGGSLTEKIKALKKTLKTDILRLKADHAIVIAPSGAGKGIGFVIPTLLDYEGSVLVTDIKGENYAVTARARREKGREVSVFDPFKITSDLSLSINFLDFLDPLSPSVVEDTNVIAHLLCPTPPFETGNFKYFMSQGAATIHCLLLYVACSENVPQENKHLAFLYDLLCQPHESLKLLLTEIYEHKELAFGVASRLAGSLLSTDSRELSGILNSARLELRFLDTPSLRDVTQTSTFSLSEMTQGTTDLYLVIPPEKLETHHRLLRLIIGLTFVEMQRSKAQKGAHKLLFLIDELPAVGYLSHIENALIYGRGYGVSVVGIAQTIELIQAVYPKSWKTFFSNHLALFFGTTDQETASYLSQSLGRQTIQVTSQNESKSARKGDSSKQEGKTLSETARPLLTPEEIKELGQEIVIAFYRGYKPFLLKRLNYLTHPAWKGKFDPNPLHEKELPWE